MYEPLSACDVSTNDSNPSHFQKVKEQVLKIRTCFFRGAPERSTEGAGLLIYLQEQEVRSLHPRRATAEALHRMTEQQRGCACVDRRVCEPNLIAANTRRRPEPCLPLKTRCVSRCWFPRW